MFLQEVQISVTLLLQVGAACRQGYLDFGQVRTAAAELAEKGEFKEGKYHFEDENGQSSSVDGYEAVFSHAAGFAPRNPAPRFEGPVIINADAVEPMESAEGGTTRFFGTFNEYGLTLSQRVAGAGETLTLRPGTGQKALFYIHAGALEADGAGDLGQGTALELAAGEQIEGTAKDDLAIFQIDLPNFGDAASAAA